MNQPVDPSLAAAKQAAAVAAVGKILDKNMGPFQRRMVTDAMVQTLVAAALSASDAVTSVPTQGPST